MAKKRKRRQSDVGGTGLEQQQQHSGTSTSAGVSAGDESLAAADWRSKAITKLDQMPREMVKYWYARYRLFSLYDSGILLDAQSWYSATPESIAGRIATHCRVARPSNGSESRPLTILDPFCGAGGNTIQFALSAAQGQEWGNDEEAPPVKVIAIDLDPVKVEMARHNARIYGVPDGQIVWLVGDALEFMRDWVQAHSSQGTSKSAQISEDAKAKWGGQLQSTIDIVFLSPPWGGVTYQDSSSLVDTPAQTPVRKSRPTDDGATSAMSPSEIDPTLLQQFDLPVAFASRHTRAESHGDPAGPASVPPVPQSAAARIGNELEEERDPRHYSLSCLQPLPGPELVALASQITNNLCLYLPRNCSLKDVVNLAESAKPPIDSAASQVSALQHPVAIEEQFLGRSFKALAAYFGDLSAQWDPLTDERIARHQALLKRQWSPRSREAGRT